LGASAEAQSESTRYESVRPAGEALHLGWARLRAALRGCGVAPGLVSGFRDRVGAHGVSRPEPEAVFAVVDDWFRAARDRRGRYIGVRTTDRESARRILARIAARVPELPVLILADEPAADERALVLRTFGATVRVARGRDGSVTVDALFEAVNALLSKRGCAFRFLPLDGPDDAIGYLAVDRAGAEMLDGVDLWALPLAELEAFAAWPLARLAAASSA
jgi:hypothetical protein